MINNKYRKISTISRTRR